MEENKVGGKGLMAYIEENKTTIKTFPTCTGLEGLNRMFKEIFPPTTPKMPRRIPKRKK